MNSILTALIFQILLWSFFAHAAIPEVEYQAAEKMALEIIDGVNTEARQMGIQTRSQDPAYQTASLTINIPYEFILDVLQNGAKTLHVTGESSGDLEPERRRLIEGLIAQRHFSERFTKIKGKHLMPKYAFVLFPKTPRSQMGQYGNAFIVLKNHVKARTTWTPKDSFALEDSEPRSFSLKKGHLNTFAYGVNNIERLGSYFEAQVWGPIDARDVAEVVLPRELWAEDYLIPYVEPIAREIARLGIPISILHDKGTGYEHRLRKRRTYKPFEFPPEFRVLSSEERKALHWRLYDMEEPEYVFKDLVARRNRRIINKLILPNLPQSIIAHCQSLLRSM